MDPNSWLAQSLQQLLQNLLKPCKRMPCESMREHSYRCSKLPNWNLLWLLQKAAVIGRPYHVPSYIWWLLVQAVCIYSGAILPSQILPKGRTRDLYCNMPAATFTWGCWSWPAPFLWHSRHHKCFDLSVALDMFWKSGCMLYSLSGHTVHDQFCTWYRYCSDAVSALFVEFLEHQSVTHCCIELLLFQSGSE